MAGIYVHIPFCIKKCSYCDFVSFVGSKSMQTEYVNNLLKEISIYSGTYTKPISTVFIGGGTPSVLYRGAIVSIIDALKSAFTIKKDAEITIECNPGTVDKTSLAEYKNCGINRISFGLQSANDRILKSISRIHSFNDFLQGLEAAKAVGFTNINADIMYGLPNQSIADLQNTLNTVCNLNLSHISAYSLILEENTRLYDMVMQKKTALPDENTEYTMHRLVIDTLKKNGYTRYEISNYARPGFECKHNLCYWNCDEYLGFGLNSHSAVLKNGIFTRYCNTMSLTEYNKMLMQNKIPIAEVSQITGSDAMNEFLMLGLRKTNGVSVADFKKRFGCDPLDVYKDGIKKHHDYIKCDKDRMFLTEHGLDIQNIILCDLI